MLTGIAASSQTGITTVTTSTAPAASSFTYVNGVNTYNWGLAPNNTEVHLTGFTAGIPLTYVNSLDGTVKLRRVDNAGTTGPMTLVWVEASDVGTTFNMLPEYKNDFEAFLDNNIYNEGADNLLDNTAPNSNNIERFDWILPGGFSTSFPAQAGFPVFDRGNAGSHDPFVIAAITSLDGSNNPLTYSNIVRVASTDYGDPASSNVTYNVLKAVFPADLIYQSGPTTQGRGGVFISLQDLGIAADVPIYGYSLFANDLPLSATPADLVDWTNTTFFPTNTAAANGGIELLPITGIAATATVLPTRFTSFEAVENDGIVDLRWAVENESSVNRYEIERSTDGSSFTKVNEVKTVGSHSYSVPDNISSLVSGQVFYRIKQYDQSGYYYFSKIIAIKRSDKMTPIVIYPNPAIKTLYVNVPSLVNDKGVISVTNAVGAEVINQHIQLIRGNNSFTVEGVSKLSRGVYQLSLKLNSGKTIVKQFSKQ
jgi:hypothetical protein